MHPDACSQHMVLISCTGVPGHMSARSPFAKHCMLNVVV